MAFPGGAVTDDRGVWVRADALGPALAFARNHGGPVHVVAGVTAGVVARRASQFTGELSVWTVDGDQLRVVEPEPFVADPPLDPRVAQFADVIAAAGADPVVEHGRLIGEVEGLEVARVVVGDEPRLEVGVGRFDREAHALMPHMTLADVVGVVAEHRKRGAEPHPLNRMARERGLRSRLVADPSLVGADHLLRMPAVVEAPDLRTPWPAAAAGLDLAGSPIVVVCSVGIDLDLAPAAADTRLLDGRDARLLLAVPERDAHPVTAALAAALTDPAELCGVDLG